MTWDRYFPKGILNYEIDQRTNETIHRRRHKNKKERKKYLRRDEH